MLLSLGGGAGTAQGSMGSGKEELGVGGDGESDVVGEVLRDIEGDEAIDADGFMGIGMGTEHALECDGLTGESVDTVLDGAARSREES